VIIYSKDSLPNMGWTKTGGCGLVVLLVQMTSTLVIAEEKPTSLSDARAAVEANLRTPEGKAFDEQLGNEFVAKHLGPLRQCKQAAGDDLRSFWILMKLDRDGAAKEVLLYPETKLGACARTDLLKDKFPAPPRPAYWVSVYMKVSH
jgi:hypothetical protein